MMTPDPTMAALLLVYRTEVASLESHCETLAVQLENERGATKRHEAEKAEWRRQLDRAGDRAAKGEVIISTLKVELANARALATWFAAERDWQWREENCGSACEKACRIGGAR